LPDQNNRKAVPDDTLQVRQDVAHLRRQQCRKLGQTCLSSAGVRSTQGLQRRTMRISSSSADSTPYRSSIICGDTAEPNQIMAISPLTAVSAGLLLN
jgi:hypothetical protein